ncbi:hypothetical protein ACFFMM_00395 [Micromonospora chaiyaphumensis]|uniref:Uncharacterized protein n=1 Tax=Micromonospora chaiyaphumensis TaxID=307119 RepID=A0A1C4ZIZ3_9ACTN|nr:hypothetical protein [Micromonospora chaiyaphumensis]SCF32724.1 hypothetical protein GA0070214_11515 [Micromonospora chaiyaphumensis]
MSTHCFVGTTDPANPRLVYARFVLLDGYPGVVVPALAAIWVGHARRDAHALSTAILASDWEYLDPAITATTESGLAGQRPVPGVGMTLASTTDGAIDAAEPVTVFPLSHARHLDVEWIYLIDPLTATVAVHTDDGQHLARYRLAGCLPPSPDATCTPASRPPAARHAAQPVAVRR